MIKGNFRAIPADRLRDLLADLPRGTLVVTGTAGGLALLDSELTQFGGIDLEAEGLVIYSSYFAPAARSPIQNLNIPNK